MIRRIALTILAIWFSVVPACYGQSSRVVALRAGALFDSNSGRLLTHQMVLIEGDKITAIGPEGQVQVPTGTQVIDLEKLTVLPGLIDAHTHMFPTRIG